MADQQHQTPPPATQSPTQPDPQQPPIEPDDRDDAASIDASSIGGQSSDDSQASLRSSLLDFRRENGRTYHRLSDGKYYMPNDEREQERLDITNHLWMLVFDGDFCWCPKNNGAKRVLDLGTGTGIWCLDYADVHLDAEVIGVDLSPIQPLYVPPNCSFEIDDLEKDWTWSKPFDFILARNMIGSFSDWARVVEQAYDHLEPGGYFEMQDSHWPAVSDDGTLKEDSPLYKWTRLMVEATDKAGRPLTVSDKIAGLLEAAGFEDVQQRSLKFPVSPWPKDKKLKELGLWTQAAILPGLEAHSMALFTRVLDWSPAEATMFCAQVREDVRNLNIHAYWNGNVTYGRKPLKADKQED